MNKIINTLAVLSLLLIFNCNVNGQIRKNNSKPHFGIIAGGTLSNISNYDAGNRIGFLLGVYAEKNISEKFSVLGNISWAQRGAVSKGNITAVRLDYITIPLMLKYNISQKFSISSGIGWDELMIVSSDDYKYDDLRSSDWRVPIAFGYGIADNLFLGISYNFGLTDITKNDNVKMKNNWGSIALVYVFKKKSD